MPKTRRQRVLPETKSQGEQLERMTNQSLRVVVLNFVQKRTLPPPATSGYPKL